MKRGRLHAIDAYAAAVVDGRILAGKYHKAACARHQRDRAREGSRGFPYRLELERADRFFRFASLLRHYKGRRWAGAPIVLEPYQQFRLGSLFGWVHVKTGLRRFRTSYNEVPRKNGKTLEGALVLVYATFYDGEPGAEGYTIATKRDQATLVFADAKKLVSSSDLKGKIVVRVGNLHVDATSSKAEPLGADYDSTDGLNPHVYIVDELHAYKTRGLLDVMETATGARDQPIAFQITTAGTDPVSPCGDQHDYACKVLDGILADESFFAFIASADPDDDPWAETTWIKANPNYGVSVLPDDLRALAWKAQHMPSAAATFKQKRLNLWTEAGSPWLSREGWLRGQRDDWRLEELEGAACYIGIDMSSKIDLTAVVFLFPPVEGVRASWRLVPRCVTPEDTLDDRAHRDRAPYRSWLTPGRLGATLATNPGNRIDQGAVKAIVEWGIARFEVLGVAIDPWNAGNLIAELEGLGLVVVEVPQNMAQMSAPAKDFEADVLDGLIDAGGDPLMAWCVSNVRVSTDNKDNIYPTKKRSRGRIDPVIAALLARKLAAAELEESTAEDPDLVVV